MSPLIALIWVFFLLWLILKVASRIFANYTPAAGNRFARFSLALFAIFCFEYAFPSTSLTGLERPKSAEPKQYLKSKPFADAPLTYEAISKSAPWLWPLGFLSKGEMERRLRADLAIAQARLDAIDTPGDDVISWQRVQNEQRRPSVVATHKGLQMALEQLDSRFSSEPIVAAEANHFVYQELVKAKKALEVSLFAKEKAVEKQLSELRKKFETEEIAVNDPEYLALLYSRRDIWDQVYSLGLGATERLTSRLTLDVKSRQPAAAFPNLGTLAPVFHQVRSRTHSDQVTVIGPRRGFIDTVLAIKDAATGYRRNNNTSKMTLRCAIGVRTNNEEPKLEKFCEFAIPLALNYDLTALDCVTDDADLVPISNITDSGTQVSETMCKETWIFPHASVVLSSKGLTIYPPIPQFSEGDWNEPAPLSTWEVRFAGQSYPLEAPLTLPYEQIHTDLFGITFTHKARDSVQNAQIWRDFRAPLSTFNVSRNIMEPTEGHAFTQTQAQAGLDFKDIRSFWNQDMEKRSEFRDVLRDYDEALDEISYDWFVKALPKNDSLDPRNPCHRKLISTNRTDIAIENEKQQLEAYFASMPIITCDAFRSYGELLHLLMRSDEQGSWLWMVK